MNTKGLKNGKTGRREDGKTGVGLEASRFLVFSFSMLVLALCVIGLSAQPNNLQAVLRKQSITSTNLWSPTTNQAQVYTVTAVNVSATDYWLFLIDTNTATVGNGARSAVDAIKVPAGTTGYYDFNSRGCRFASGVTIATSTTPLTLTNGAAAFGITVTWDGRPD